MKTFSTHRIAPRITVLALASSALICSSALAKNSQNDLAARTQKRVAALFQNAGRGTRDLKLSAVQQAKLKGIAQKNAPLARAIWNDSSLNQTQKMARLRALKNETNAVFTPAQKQKLAQAKTSAMFQMFQTATWVSEELQLTSAQQENIQGIAMRNYRKSGVAAGNLGALRKLMLDTDGQIAGVLTVTQRAKWNIIKRAARAEFAKNARVFREA